MWADESDIILVMAPNIGETVRKLRERRGMSQQELAEAVSVTQQAIAKLERGGVRRPGYIVELARALNVDPEELSGGTVSTRQPKPADLIDDFVPSQRNLPLLGQAEGGPDGAFEMNGETADYVARPPGLEGISTAYAIQMVGTSMEPRYMDGETLYINPRKRPTPSCYVVFQTQTEEFGPTKAFVKQYAGQDNGDVVFRQLNPEKTFKIKGTSIKSIHRVVLAGDY